MYAPIVSNDTFLASDSNVSELVDTLSYKAEIEAGFGVSSILGIFGFCLNLLLLIVLIRIIRTNKKEGASHVLIANLVFLYVLCCFPVLPLASIPLLYSAHMSDAYCFYHSLLTYQIYFTANWTEVCLAFNRVIAIYYPHKYAKFCSFKVNILLVSLTWILSFFVMVLTALFGGLVRTKELEQCEFTAKGKVGGLLVSAMTFIPWFLVAGASIAVIVRAFKIYFSRSSPGPTGNFRDSAQYSLYQRRLQVAKMLLISFIWGTLCKIPYFVTKSVAPKVFVQTPLLPSWFKIIIIAEYTFNPVIFLGMSEDYRKGVKDLIRILLATAPFRLCVDRKKWFMRKTGSIQDSTNSSERQGQSHALQELPRISDQPYPAHGGRSIVKRN